MSEFEPSWDSIPDEDVIITVTPDDKIIQRPTPRGQALTDVIKACRRQSMSGESQSDAIYKALDVLTVAHLTRRLAVDPKKI